MNLSARRVPRHERVLPDVAGRWLTYGQASLIVAIYAREVVELPAPTIGDLRKIMAMKREHLRYRLDSLSRHGLVIANVRAPVKLTDRGRQSVRAWLASRPEEA